MTSTKPIAASTQAHQWIIELPTSSSWSWQPGCEPPSSPVVVACRCTLAMACPVTSVTSAAHPWMATTAPGSVGTRPSRCEHQAGDGGVVARSRARSMPMSGRSWIGNAPGSSMAPSAVRRTASTSRSVSS